MRTSLVVSAATGSALLASLLAGCDDEPPTRHASFSDSPATRFSEYRGPYGPYYIRPSQRHFGTPPPDPALAIAAPDPTPDPLLDGDGAMTGGGPVAKKTDETTTLNQGFSYERRKIQPVTQPEATPYSMATPRPAPSARRLRPFLPPAIPSSAAGQPDAAEKRLRREEQTRRALLLSQPDSPLAATPPPASPTPSASLPETPPTPSTP